MWRWGKAEHAWERGHPAGGHRVPKESRELGLNGRLGIGQKALVAQCFWNIL